MDVYPRIRTTDTANELVSNIPNLKLFFMHFDQQFCEVDIHKRTELIRLLVKKNEAKKLMLFLTIQGRFRRKLLFWGHDWVAHGLPRDT